MIQKINVLDVGVRVSKQKLFSASNLLFIYQITTYQPIIKMLPLSSLIIYVTKFRICTIQNGSVSITTRDFGCLIYNLKSILQNGNYTRRNLLFFPK